MVMVKKKRNIVVIEVFWIELLKDEDKKDKG